MKTLVLLILVLAGLVFSQKGTLNVKERGGKCHNERLKENLLRQYARKCSDRGFEGTLGCPYNKERDIKDMRNQVLRNCIKMDVWRSGCNFKCIVDGNWSEFSAWSEYCSAPCGGGVLTRTRKCDDPEPMNGGKDCEGEAEETQACNEDPCPVNGKWSEWGSYGDCSVPCGIGTEVRERFCNNPAPEHGGEECVGESTSERECNEGECPVDGNWSEFSAWSEYCSAPCGGGVLTRTRKCDDPEPMHGGKDCDGEAEETQACNENACVAKPKPVNGRWSKYKKVGYCTKTKKCKDSTKHMERFCDNPAPVYGGKDCYGDSTKTVGCKKWECWADNPKEE